MADDREEGARDLIPYREPVGMDAVKAFIPADFPSVFRFSQLLAESGDMVPKMYVNNAQKISTAIFFGYEIGLLPLQALQSIAVINGKPSIYGDAALGLVRASGLLEDFEELYEGDYFLPNGNQPNPNFKAICRITRKGAKRPAVSEFSIGDAMMANLLGKEGPWRNYPKRMLKMRARGFGLRDEFTDILRGLVLAEEAEDYEPRDITPQLPPTPTDDDTAAPRRGRPPGKSKNKFQDDDAGQDAGKDAAKASSTSGPMIEGTATTVTTTAASHRTDAAAAEKPATPTEVVKATTTKAVEPTEPKKTAAAAEKPAGEKLPETTVNRPVPLITILPDFKDYPADVKTILVAMHTEMGAVNGVTEGLRPAWKNHVPIDNRPWNVKYDRAFEDVKNWHKKRIEDAAKAKPKPAVVDDGFDSPPNPDDDAKATDTASPPVPDNFDIEAFTKDLKKDLAECTDADSVSRVFSDWTEIPVREGIITADQLENDLKPLAIEAMARFD